MKVILISYANKPFYKSQQELKKSALKYGVDEVIDYNDIWLKKQTVFYQKNKHILSQKRGNGYWLWKPFIILDALKKLQPEDILIHVDAGALFINAVKPLIELTENKEIILFYNNGHKNSTWTKRDCFHFMDCDNDKFYNENQTLAGYIVCKKTPFVISFLEEWLEYAQNENILTDLPNICELPNLKDFIDHRHDQSILSLLAAKYSLQLYRDPSQWGNKYKMDDYQEDGEFIEDGYVNKLLKNSPYPTILNGHRLRLKFNFVDHLKYFLLYFNSKK